MEYYFPFGETLKKVEQTDRSNKDVFVLGVYASVVHAKWTRKGKQICQALAVANEPYIFWDGNIDQARDIISKINIPKEAGELHLPQNKFNGPSGKVLIENILNPLGYERKDAWLCDLIPEARINLSQRNIIENKYMPLIEELGLNGVSIPDANKRCIDNRRIKEITDEIVQSNAKELILLGDEPIKKYLKHVIRDLPFKNLKQYTDRFGYGNRWEIKIQEKSMYVIPLAHPRHIGKMKPYSEKWFREHKIWEKNLNRR